MNAFLRLAIVELSRLLRRRAVLVLIAACLIIPVIIGVAIVIDTRPPSASEIADVEQQMERDRNDPSYAGNLQDCTDRPEEWGISPGADAAEVEEQCNQQFEPVLENYLYHSPLDIAQERDGGSGIAIILLLSIAMMLLGTTFTGHDWASGSVSNQLLFEPRRLRVWFAKALAVTGTATVLAATVFTTYWLVIGAVARSRDRLADGVLLDCLQMGWRAAGVAGAAALLGFALTMLFRNTVATLGILFGIALAGGIILGVFGISDRWNPAVNVAAVITVGVDYYVEVPCSPEQIEEMGGDYGCGEQRRLTFAQGAGVLGTAVGASCLVSLLWFRRRDVP